MPIHLIWGDDYGAIDRYIEKFIQEVIDPNWISINLSRLNGQDLDQAHQSLQEVRTPPFGNGDRIILVKKSPFCNGCTTELSSHFESILNLIPEKSHLILNNQSKPDGRLKTTKLVQELIQKNQAFEKSFLLPPVWDSLGQRKLIERTANDLNIELTKEAIFSLVDALGNDSQRLTVELEKLVLLEEAKTQNSNSSKTVISQETVNDLIQGLSTNSLEICNYLISAELGKTISRIDSLLDSGEPALRILATLTSQIRGWLWVSLLEQGGEKEVSFIAKQAGIANPKRIYVIRKQIKGKSPVFFIDLLSRVLEIESLLKKGYPAKNAFRDGLLTKL